MSGEGRRWFRRPKRQLSNPAAEFIENGHVDIPGSIPQIQFIRAVDSFGTKEDGMELETRM
jgi:hypothetical protein